MDTKEQNRMDVDGLELLRCAVVEQACKDYVKAYKKGLYLGNLEWFFLSDHFRLFSSLDPEWLMSSMKKAVDRNETLFDSKYSQF